MPELGRADKVEDLALQLLGQVVEVVGRGLRRLGFARRRKLYVRRRSSGPKEEEVATQP